MVFIRAMSFHGRMFLIGPAAAGASRCPYPSSLALGSKLESYIVSSEGGYDIPWTSQEWNKKLDFCPTYLL